MGHVDLDQKTFKKTCTLETVNPEFQHLLSEVALMMLTPETYYPPGSRMYAITNETADSKEKDEDAEYHEDPDLFVDTLGEAELVTSLLPDGTHMPVLDIDVPCDYIPSTTTGHGHLYFHKPMPWAHMIKLMEVMAEVGLLEKGYVEASKSRAYSAVRLPWVKKGEKFLGNVTHMIPLGTPSYFSTGKGVKVPEQILDKIDFVHDLVFMTLDGSEDPDGEDDLFTIPETVVVFPGQAGKEYKDVEWKGTYYSDYQASGTPWSGEEASGCIGGCQAAMQKGTKAKNSIQQMIPLSSKELKEIKDKYKEEQAAKKAEKAVKMKKVAPKKKESFDDFFAPVEWEVEPAKPKVKVPPQKLSATTGLNSNTIPVLVLGKIVTFVPDKITHWFGFDPKHVYTKKHGTTGYKVMVCFGEKDDQKTTLLLQIYHGAKTYISIKPSKEILYQAVNEVGGWVEASINSLPEPGKYSWPELGKDMVTAAAEKQTEKTPTFEAKKPVEVKAPKVFWSKFYAASQLTPIVADIYPKMSKPITTHIPTDFLTKFTAGVEKIWAKKALFGNDTLVILKFKDGDYTYISVGDGSPLKDGKVQINSEVAADMTIKDVEASGSGKGKWQVMKLPVPFPDEEFDPDPDIDYQIGAHGVGNHIWVTAGNKALSINPSYIPEAGYKQQAVFFSEKTKQYITFDPLSENGKIYSLTEVDGNYVPKKVEKLYPHTIHHLKNGTFSDYDPASYSYKVD